MKWVFRLFAAMLFGAFPLLAAGFNAFEGPKPVLVILVSDPWIWVMGSDTPKLVIYQDGQVIQLFRARLFRPEISIRLPAW
jgi:fatty acid desaturase